MQCEQAPITFREKYYCSNSRSLTEKMAILIKISGTEQDLNLYLCLYESPISLDSLSQTAADSPRINLCDCKCKFLPGEQRGHGLLMRVLIKCIFSSNHLLKSYPPMGYINT